MKKGLPFRWHPLALALALGFSLNSPSLFAASASARPIQIEAGDLDQALRQWSRETGLRLDAAPALLKGRKTPGFKASLSPDQALERLLQGQGLIAQRNAAGDYQITPEPAGTTEGSATPPTLKPVHVQSSALLPAGERVLSGQELKEMPTHNQSLSEALASHPAVRQKATANSSLTRGSMEVEDISFHGASPYQNLFQIDGMDGTNNLNPSNDNKNLQVGNVASNSQAYYIDTALLDEVRIHDSNIPVEYGRFQGGVVDARVKRASGEDGARLSYRTSHSGLSKQTVSPGYAANYEQGSDGYTPKWKKDFFDLSAEKMLGENLGLVLGASHRVSDIRRTSYEGDEAKEQDVIDNLLAKMSWWGQTGTVSDLTLKFAQRKEDRSDSFFRATEWQNRHEAYGLSWNLEKETGLGKFSSQIGWDRFTDRRDSNSDEFVTYYTVKPRSTISGGGFGSELTERDSYSIKNRLDLQPFSTGPVDHKAYAGFEAQWVSGDFERERDVYSYQEYRTTPEATPQYRNKYLYRSGKAEVSYRNQALFATDQMLWRDFTLDIGLRLDRDSYLDTQNLAPRTRLDWNPFGDKKTRITVGASRYYGTGSLAMAIAEAKSALRQQLTNSKGEAVSTTTPTTISHHEGLKTPYNDEYTLSLTRVFSAVQGTLSYVRREGRDQISSRSITGGTEYYNAGESSTDSFSFSLQNNRPWIMARASWNGQFGIDYSHAKRNFLLTDSDGGTVDEGKIYYNGKLIDTTERPAADFNQPWRATAQLNGMWNDWGITWNNRLSWLGKRKEAFYVGLHAGDKYEMYEETDVPAYWTWDTSVSYRLPQHKALELRFEINNALNKQPVLVPTSPNISTNRDIYGSGREIWLQLAYQI